MAKNHAPGGFDRPSGYKSDLEVAEERGTRINTSFGSQNHNVYVHNAEHTHEHFWYDPATGVSGYHGENVPTRSNHPDLSKLDNNVETPSTAPETVNAGTPSTTPETEAVTAPATETEVGTEPTVSDTEVDNDGLDDDGLDDDGLDL